MARPRINIDGQKFGNLVVLKYSGVDKRRQSLFLCRCDCGKDTIVKGTSLRSGRTKSCGCLRNTTGVTAKLPDGISARNALFCQYKKNAEYRDYEFSLTLEQFSNLTHGECYYCGDSPKSIYKSYRSTGDYIYNGIDRIDNSIGYTIDNCVPCCGICNKMKLTLGVKEFLNHIIKIYNRHKS